MPRNTINGQYRSLFINNHRLEDYTRLQGWVEAQPARRLRAKSLSVGDAVLDLAIGYLDVIEGSPDTQLARDLCSTITEALHPAKGGVQL